MTSKYVWDALCSAENENEHSVEIPILQRSALSEMNS